jgi:hypothetical protein
MENLTRRGFGLAGMGAALASAGAVLSGKAILTLNDAPLPAENREGIAVVRHGDETMVALISDDNESVLQRSLLLLFTLRG